MTIEVIRVLVYTYPDEEERDADMGRWGTPAEGIRANGRRGTIESMLHTPPKRTPRQQRVLDIANTMVRARNETARGVPTVAFIDPEEDQCESCQGSGRVPEYHGQGNTEWLGCPDCEGTGKVRRIDVPDAIDAEIVPPKIDAPAMVMPPYRPATWLNPPPLPEGVLDIGDVYDEPDVPFFEQLDRIDAIIAEGEQHDRLRRRGEPEA